MSDVGLSIRNSKLNLKDDWDWEWIGHPRGDCTGDAAAAIKNNRADLFVVGEIDDDGASYSYDDYALVRLGADYYLLNTSGCSCPSPCETWGVVEGPCSLDDMEKKIEEWLSSDKCWGVVERQPEDFRGLIRAAREEGER